MKHQMINLTNEKKLNLDNSLTIIPMSDYRINSAQRLLNEPYNLMNLENFCIYLSDASKMESDVLQENGRQALNNGQVAVLIDAKNIQPSYIKMLNFFYPLFDINSLEALNFYPKIREYGEVEECKNNAFFQLAFKCIFTVNTKIWAMDYTRQKMSDTEYKKQDFFSLMKKITEEMKFVIKIDGKKYYVMCEGMWLTINLERVIKISELEHNIHKVFSMLNRKIECY